MPQNIDCAYLDTTEYGNTRCTYYQDNVYAGHCNNRQAEAQQCPRYVKKGEAMPELNVVLPEKWRDPRLKPLPKHIHGEFKTLARRAEMIERKIQQLKRLEETDIPVELYYVENPDGKYFDRWKELMKKKGYLEYIFGDWEAYAYQSCWPEEAAGMIFQHFYKHLDVRFKWWALSHISGSQLSLNKANPSMRKGALPNINGCYYTCPGDYGDKFVYGSTISKLVEFYNYTSSPNLRENRSVTSIYSAVATAFQYCDLEVKKGAETKATTIAELWLNLVESLPQEEVVTMKEQQCSYCNGCSNFVAGRIHNPNGDRVFGILTKIMKVLDNDLDQVENALNFFNENTLRNMVQGMDQVKRHCNVCCFRFTDTDEARRAYDLFKDIFDKQVYPEKFVTEEDQEVE